MRELHVVALSEDGRFAVLATSLDATRGGYRIALDDRLAAALRGDLAHPEEAVPDAPPLTPKVIQARLRAGESAEQISLRAGVPLDRVERFSGPVLSERARVIEMAQAAVLERPRRGRSAAPLGEAVEHHLAQVPTLRPESTQWTARREPDGRWLVEVVWVARERTRFGRWYWDPSDRAVTPVDTVSAALGHLQAPQERAPGPAVRSARGAAAAAPPGATADQAGRSRSEAPEPAGRRTTARRLPPAVVPEESRRAATARAARAAALVELSAGEPGHGGPLHGAAPASSTPTGVARTATGRAGARSAPTAGATTRGTAAARSAEPAQAGAPGPGARARTGSAVTAAADVPIHAAAVTSTGAATSTGAVTSTGAATSTGVATSSGPVTPTGTGTAVSARAAVARPPARQRPQPAGAQSEGAQSEAGQAASRQPARQRSQPAPRQPGSADPGARPRRSPSSTGAAPRTRDAGTAATGTPAPRSRTAGPAVAWADDEPEQPVAAAAVARRAPSAVPQEPPAPSTPRVRSATDASARRSADGAAPVTAPDPDAPAVLRVVPSTGAGQRPTAGREARRPRTSVPAWADVLLSTAGGRGSPRPRTDRAQPARLGRACRARVGAALRPYDREVPAAALPRRARVLALVLGLELTCACAAGVLLQPGASVAGASTAPAGSGPAAPSPPGATPSAPSPSAPSPGAPSPGAPSPAASSSAAGSPVAETPEDDVTALLQARSRAVLSRDREAFLATVDPRSTAFRTRQAALFDALAEVPLTDWSYDVYADDVQRADPRLTERYGTWWAPEVVLRHALKGIDDDPVESAQHLTFVRRSSRWYVAADDDFAARGDRTDRLLWDDGPVSVVRGRRSLVLGHPGQLPEMRRLAREVDAAVPRVTAVWGTGWKQRVAVLVPASQRELGTLVRTTGGLGPIAALAVSGPVRRATARGGDRVLVNPPNMARLGPAGRQVVLRHEVTHVASRAATGPMVPAWLAEGLADHVGFLRAAVPVRVVAEELASDVRAGRLPIRLPPDRAFSGDNDRLAQAYEGSWLAVELLVRRYGEARVLRFYRALGAVQRGSRDEVLDEVLRAQLDTSTTALVAAWRADLRARLT